MKISLNKNIEFTERESKNIKRIFNSEVSKDQIAIINSLTYSTVTHTVTKEFTSKHTGEKQELEHTTILVIGERNNRTKTIGIFTTANTIGKFDKDKQERFAKDLIVNNVFDTIEDSDDFYFNQIKDDAMHLEMYLKYLKSRNRKEEKLKEKEANK